MFSTKVIGRLGQELTKTRVLSANRLIVRLNSTVKYTDKHEWIRVNGNVGTVGITDYAQVFMKKIGLLINKGLNCSVLRINLARLCLSNCRLWEANWNDRRSLQRWKVSKP